MTTDPFLTVRTACIGVVQLEGRTSLRARVPAALAQAEALVGDHLATCAAQHGAERLASPIRGSLYGFVDAASAVRFAMDVQEGLLDLAWPSTLLLRPELADVHGPDEALLFRGLRVRIALVQGPVWLGGGNVLGPAVHRVGRLVGLAYGGQTLLTDEVRQAIGERDAVLIGLGRHPLVGEAGRHRIHQALPRSLAARRFPPPRTHDQRGGNARDDADFVGRQQDVAALEELSELGVRIVSIEGEAGVGKSHLARQYARLRQNHQPGAGGVWWLGPAVADLESLVHAVADVLGVGLQYTPDVGAGVRQLGRALASRGPTLLALDVVSPIPALREAIEHWTTLAPEATFVVATPSRLKARGEVAYVLGPLGLPGDDEGAAPRDADAVRLFANRAQLVQASLPTPDDPDLIEMLVQHRGNPRRVRLLAGLLLRCSVEEVIAIGSPGSLEGLLEAAWETLAGDERDLLRACVASGDRAFDLETLWVAGHATDATALARLELQGLVDRVVAGLAPDLVRYTVGGEIRAWVTEQDQGAAITATPADAEAETAPRLQAPGSAPAEDTEDTETETPVGFGAAQPIVAHPDGATAAWLGAHWAAWTAPMDWALTSDDPADLDRAMARWLDHDALRHHLPLLDTLPLVGSLLGRYDQLRGIAPARIIAMWLSSAELHLRADALTAAASDLDRAATELAGMDDPFLARCHADLAAQVAVAKGVPPPIPPEEAPHSPVQVALMGLEALSRGDDEDVVEILTPLVEPPGPDALAAQWAVAVVHVLRRTGRADAARDLAVRWADGLASLGDARADARIAEITGWVDYHVGRLDDAERTWLTGLERARRAGDRWAEGLLLGPAGLLALSLGDLEGCRTRLVAALAIHREAHDAVREGQVTGMLGILDHVSHQPESARESYRRAFELTTTRGPHRDGALVAAFGAALEAELGDLEAAELQWDMAESLQATLRDPDVTAAMDQLRLALWWARAQSYEQAGEPGRAETLVGQARERIAAALARETPLPGEARLALARMNRLFGRS